MFLLDSFRAHPKPELGREEAEEGSQGGSSLWEEKQVNSRAAAKNWVFSKL